MAGILLVLVLILLPSSVLARGNTLVASGPQITNVVVGFNDKFRPGCWIPVQVSLANNEASFDGYISITLPSLIDSSTGGASSPRTYQLTISLPPLSKKQVTMYVPIPQQLTERSLQLSVELIDSNDTLITRNQTTLTSLANNDLSIGLLTDSSDPSTQSLSRAVKDIASAMPQTDVITSADMFPTRAEALDNFDLLIINNFTSSNLSEEQLATLQTWIGQGGTLIITGGPEWQRTLKPLPSDLLPVAPGGNGTLPPGTHLLPAGLPLSAASNGQAGNDTLPASIPVSVGTARPGASVLLAAKTIPLLARTDVGLGQVYYLAYDPLLTPLANWDQIEHLWNTLIMRATGNRLLTTSSGDISSTITQNNPLSNLDAPLQMLIPNIIPSPWLILGLLLGYVLFLGPVRLILIRRLKKRDWSWPIALCIILIFSLFSYGLVLQQRGTAITNSSISRIQLSRPGPNGSSEHVTDYIGVFVPSQGDFQVRIPGTNLVEPLDFSSGSTLTSTAGPPTTIINYSDMTEARLQGAQIWSLNTLVSTHDTRTAGGLSSHLTLSQSDSNGLALPLVSGSVTNNLPFSIKDAYLLIGDDFLSLGNLTPGQTRQVRLFLLNSMDTTQTPTSSSLLYSLSRDLNLSIDQVTSQDIYRAIDSNNERQRHLAILASTITNTSFCSSYANSTCSQASTTNNIATASTSTENVSSQKRLQLTNAPVTFIGWVADQTNAMQQVTVNGDPHTGIHETLLQAPLDMNYRGKIQIPNSLIDSQLVDFQVAQGNVLASGDTPSLYCMNTGHILFELTVPNMPNARESSLSINEISKNSLTTQNFTCSQQQGLNDVSRLQVTLYNWQTGSWDSQQFVNIGSNSYQLSIGNAQPYIGAGGRVLLQFANHDQTLGTSIFTTPEMEISGTVAS